MRKIFALVAALVCLLPAAASAQMQNFNLINRTGSVIAMLNVSPVSQNQWGPDILGAGVIQDGQTARVSFPPGVTECNFDMRVTFDDGDTAQLAGVNLCTTLVITVTYDEDEEETRFNVQ